MSDSYAEPINHDLEFTQEEMRPVVEAFRKKYGDDVSQLISLLDGPDTMEAGLAIQRLGELEAPEAVEPLIHLLDAPPDTLLAVVAITVLGRLGDSRAVQSLIDLVESAEERAERETDHMRPSSDVRGWLSALIGWKWWREIRESTCGNVRTLYLRNGISALGQLGDKRAIGSIHMRLDDPDERVQAAAVEALQRLESA